jgi:hypothetical protein
VLPVLLACGHRDPAPPEETETDIPECRAYVAEYGACLARLGPGAASVVAERMTQLRTSLQLAGANEEQRGEIAKSCSLATQSLRSSCQ